MDPRKYDSERGAYSQLQQNLVGPAPGEALPTTSATTMLEIVAPMNMSEGYTFAAKVAGKTIQATVPEGGVKKDQKFSIPLPTNDDGNNVLGFGTRLPKSNVPVGAWKDGICGCFAYGPCHGHCTMSWFCPSIAIGQVITRLRLNIWGEQGDCAETTGAYQKIVAATIFFWLLYLVLFIYSSVVGVWASPFFWMERFLLFVFVGYNVYVVWNVRRHVRSKYAIPDQCNLPPETEDVCCAFCCLQLSTAQMLRHTADYDTYRDSCCSDTGLPAHVPSIV